MEDQAQITLMDKNKLHELVAQTPISPTTVAPTPFLQLTAMPLSWVPYNWLILKEKKNRICFMEK